MSLGEIRFLAVLSSIKRYAEFILGGLSFDPPCVSVLVDAEAYASSWPRLWLGPPSLSCLGDASVSPGMLWPKNRMSLFFKCFPITSATNTNKGLVNTLKSSIQKSIRLLTPGARSLMGFIQELHVVSLRLWFASGLLHVEGLVDAHCLLPLFVFGCCLVH